MDTFISDTEMPLCRDLGTSEHCLVSAVLSSSLRGALGDI